jgi:hypothetical protein
VAVPVRIPIYPACCPGRASALNSAGIDPIQQLRASLAGVAGRASDPPPVNVGGLYHADLDSRFRLGRSGQVFSTSFRAGELPSGRLVGRMHR